MDDRLQLIEALRNNDIPITRRMDMLTASIPKYLKVPEQGILENIENYMRENRTSLEYSLWAKSVYKVFTSESGWVVPTIVPSMISEVTMECPYDTYVSHGDYKDDLIFLFKKGLTLAEVSQMLTH